MSVAECQQRVSSLEFAEWIARDSIEPWGERRSDWQFALLASSVVNVFSDENNKVMPEDFLLGDLFDESREQAEMPEEEKADNLTKKILLSFKLGGLINRLKD